MTIPLVLILLFLTFTVEAEAGDPPPSCQIATITSSACDGATCDQICGVPLAQGSSFACNSVRQGLIKSIYGETATAETYLFDAVCLKKETVKKIDQLPYTEVAYHWYECDSNNVVEKKGAGITSPNGINKDNPQFLCTHYGVESVDKREKWIQCGGKLFSSSDPYKDRGLLVPNGHYYGNYYCQSNQWTVVPLPVLSSELKFALSLKGGDQFNFKYNSCNYQLKIAENVPRLQLEDVPHSPSGIYDSTPSVAPAALNYAPFKLIAAGGTFFPAKINNLVYPPLNTPDSPVVELVISAPTLSEEVLGIPYGAASDPCPLTALPLVQIPALVIPGSPVLEGDLDGSGAVNQFDVKWIIENPEEMWGEKLQGDIKNLNQLVKAMFDEWS